MTIQSSAPRSHDPSYLVTKGESSDERMEISDWMSSISSSASSRSITATEKQEKV